MNHFGVCMAHKLNCNLFRHTGHCKHADIFVPELVPTHRNLPISICNGYILAVLYNAFGSGHRLCHAVFSPELLPHTIIAAFAYRLCIKANNVCVFWHFADGL